MKSVNDHYMADVEYDLTEQVAYLLGRIKAERIVDVQLDSKPGGMYLLWPSLSTYLSIRGAGKCYVLLGIEKITLDRFVKVDG